MPAKDKTVNPLGTWKIALPRSQDKTAHPQYPRNLPERKIVRSAAHPFKLAPSAVRKAAASGPQVIRQAPPELKPKRKPVSISN
jgi:hypothetical protein